jgi:hypothetical protein
MQTTNLKTFNPSAARTRSKNRNKRQTGILQHEGIKCTRKFGNPISHKFGTQKKTSFLSEKVAEFKDIPGPSHYSPNISKIKPRVAAALCDTGE